jgi:hypothetical protein
MVKPSSACEKCRLSEAVLSRCCPRTSARPSTSSSSRYSTASSTSPSSGSSPAAMDGRRPRAPLRAKVRCPSFATAAASGRAYPTAASADAVRRTPTRPEPEHADENANASEQAKRACRRPRRTADKTTSQTWPADEPTRPTRRASAPRMASPPHRSSSARQRRPARRPRPPDLATRRRPRRPRRRTRPADPDRARRPARKRARPRVTRSYRRAILRRGRIAQRRWLAQREGENVSPSSRRGHQRVERRGSYATS